MKRTLGTFIVSLTLMSGCSQAENKFIGSWKSIDLEHSTITIEKNGDNLIVRKTEPTFATRDDVRTMNLPATINNEFLQVNTDTGIINFAIDESTGNLTSGTEEFIKQK